MSDATRLVLVRHGESNVSVEGIVGGPKTCSGLSPFGVRQVEALRDRLAATGEVRADVLLASTLRRAVETAEVLAPALGDLSVEQDEDLSEWLPGECDGLSWEEFTRRYRPEGWRFDPYEPFSPGGESLAEFQVRAASALSRVAREHAGRTVVIGCHGGIVEASMTAFLGLLHWRRDTRLATSNASLTELELRARDQVEGRAPVWRLVRYNDAAHRAGVA
ncbi:MAG: histidine phosphatase family protein [Acidimicrobiia bacterium]|nr:histidine phosphatase family protein [Acidimicrobiia bacterium]